MMRQVLERLDYIGPDGVLQLKGRAACCIEAADELVTTEVLARGVLNGLSVSETVALLSCLLPVARGSSSRRGAGSGVMPRASKPLPLPSPALDNAVAAINAIAAEVAEVVCGCSLKAEHGAGNSFAAVAASDAAVPVELIPAVMGWANGASFEKAWLLSPNTFEGTLVRCLRSLDEMLKQLNEAAAALGDSELRKRFEECTACIHRGIAFCNSLYLQGD